MLGHRMKECLARIESTYPAEWALGYDLQDIDKQRSMHEAGYGNGTWIIHDTDTRTQQKHIDKKMQISYAF